MPSDLYNKRGEAGRREQESDDFKQKFTVVGVVLTKKFLVTQMWWCRVVRRCVFQEVQRVVLFVTGLFPLTLLRSAKCGGVEELRVLRFCLLEQNKPDS